MAAELSIRDARTEELETVSAVLAAAYAEYIPPDETLTPEERAGWDGYRRNIADVWSRVSISSTIVAERDGRVVGSVNYYAPGQADSLDGAWPEGWASIRLLGVPPEARGTGIGRALMAECLRRARADGATTMGLHTTRLMDVARAMYVRLGFKRVPAYDFHPAPDFTVEAFQLDL